MKNAVLLTPFVIPQESGQYLLLLGIDDYLHFSIEKACAEILNFAKADRYL